ncbi:unnamed protein product [Protopolystoma xenopodis]|uniref:Uncharacterized protein n=1 Tax=Protopolystoma xenopodis TaxID=117903 RepID=A0A3S4ZGL6_9PLAT|nr:unnamed protein product [Protopolystoma xenopodis]
MLPTARGRVLQRYAYNISMFAQTPLVSSISTIPQVTRLLIGLFLQEQEAHSVYACPSPLCLSSPGQARFTVVSRALFRQQSLQVPLAQPPCPTTCPALAPPLLLQHPMHWLITSLAIPAYPLLLTGLPNEIEPRTDDARPGNSLRRRHLEHSGQLSSSIHKE